jgi:hypothetical protein
MVLHKRSTQMLQYCLGIVHSCSFHIPKQYVNIFATYISQKLYISVSYCYLLATVSPPNVLTFLASRPQLTDLLSRVQRELTSQSVSCGQEAENVRTLEVASCKLNSKTLKVFAQNEQCIYFKK